MAVTASETIKAREHTRKAQEQLQKAQLEILRLDTARSLGNEAHKDKIAVLANRQVTTVAALEKTVAA